MPRFAAFLLSASLLPAFGQVPNAADIVVRYVQALGGAEALAKVSSWGAMGSFTSPTYGSMGRYEEYTKLPDRWLQTIRVPNYGVVQRCANGTAGWEETPEFGVEELRETRLSEARRAAGFQQPARWKEMYTSLTSIGRKSVEGRPALEVRGETRDGGVDTLLFDTESGLLLAVDTRETARDGSSRTVRLCFEDYRDVSGIRMPHTLRFVSDELIWIVRRGVAGNVPLEDSRFQKP